MRIFFCLFLNQRMNVSWHLIICQKERMGWDGMSRWRVWVSSSTTLLFFWVQTNNTHTFKLIPHFNISGRLYSPAFLTSLLTHLLTDIGPAKTWRQSPKTSITRLLNLLLIIGGTSLLIFFYKKYARK